MENLAAHDVVVRFGGLVALDSVSVEVPLGRVTGLIGPNGAGKTTLFNVCCGFQPATQGTVELFGRSVTKYSAARRARLGLARTFQRMELFGSLTVRENIAVAAESAFVTNSPLSQLGLVPGVRRLRRAVADQAEELMTQVGLLEVADRPAGELSAGMGRLVELARAMARKPRILLLDEPSSGLDVAESANFGEQVRRLATEQGVGILMVEHDMSLALTVSDWIYVLDFGRMLMAGTPTEVRVNEEVRAAYLGTVAV